MKIIRLPSPWRGISLLLPVFAFLLITSWLSAQCTLTCVNVQISLDQDCNSEVLPDMLLEGEPNMNCVGPIVVEIYDNMGVLIPTSPFITGDYIGEVLTGHVVDQATGNLCSGTLTVEDKLPPSIMCSDTTVTCFDSTEPSFIGLPIANDNCEATSALIFSYSDLSQSFNCMSNNIITTITRTWTVADSSWNSSTCEQKIDIVRPDLSEIIFPDHLNNIQGPALSCVGPNTAPSGTGEPSYNGQPVAGACNFGASHSDVQLPACDGAFTIFRTWTIFDLCSGATASQQQIIEVLDNNPPNLVCPADITVNTSNLDCTATVILPQPIVTDTCCDDALIAISVSGTFGTVQGTTIFNLVQGAYNATCIATDDCGNAATCLFNVTVKDIVPPVAVSASSPNVSLLPQDPTYVNAATFDGGSWDNCGEIEFFVRRLETTNCPGVDASPFDTIVPFYCCDAGKTVPIELKVVDIEGNSSLTTSIASVFDNVNPGISCPPNITLGCGADFTDTTLTGVPIATDNCSGYVVSHADSVDLNNCGEGLVMREWKVVDAFGRSASCTQQILLENPNPFYINPVDPLDPNDNIIWPEDYYGSTCNGGGVEPMNLPPGNDYPQLVGDTTCSLIAYSYSNTYLVVSPNSCIEILRHWTIIDWCQFNPLTMDGLWEYAQIIQIANTEVPIITSNCEDQEFCSYDPQCQVGEAMLSISATDDCTAAEDLLYRYDIDFFEDGTIDDSGTTNEIEDDFPIGTHEISFNVEDGCNNFAYCSWSFTIYDCKAPTVVCETGLIIEISNSMPPIVDVWASDFNASSSDNCDAAADLIFSFSSDTANTQLIFDCSHIGHESVEVWATDTQGNQDFCTTTVEIQDNMNACTSSASLSGSVSSLVNDPVALVNVLVNDGSTNTSQTTNTSGNFNFMALPVGGDYSITPDKNVNLLNGVTTFDMVLIIKHILGAQILDSPYKLIAADVNNSGTITTLDLVAIRKVILQIDDTFPNNNSWRFIDLNYEFPNPADPFQEPFPETVSINNLSMNELVDFIAVKIGDVNDTVDPEN